MKMHFHPFLKKLLLFIVCCIFSLSAFSGEEKTEPKPQAISELKAVIEALMKERNIPSVGIAMVNQDGLVWVEAMGKANIEGNISADKNTLYRIGSTSKMFVSLSILKLVEEGRLSLQDKVSDLAPEIAFTNQWESTDPVRIVHLLEHTTGWDDLHIVEYAHNDPTPATLKQGLDFHPHSRVSRWKPGSRMSYCNSGPPVAAYIVEKITGQIFEDYVAANFFTPIGMNTADYFYTEAVSTKGAVQYSNGNQSQDYEHIIVRPSGSINASVNDMAKFIQFFVNRGMVNGQQIISPASLHRMETPKSSSAAKAGQSAGYGLSNYNSPHKNWEYREHNGTVNGGRTELAYLPIEGIGHVILVNTGDYEAFKAVSTLVRDYEVRNLKTPEVSSNIELSESANSISGYYYNINPRMEIMYFIERIVSLQKLTLVDNQLIIQPVINGEPTTYIPSSKYTFKSIKTGLITVTKTQDPLAGEVVHVGDSVLKPLSAIVAFTQLGVAILWALVIISSVLFFLVWIIRKLHGSIPTGATIRIRLYPLLASVSIILTQAAFTIGFSDPFSSFGTANSLSISIMLFTIAFAIFAVAGSYTSIAERNSDMNRGTYWYSTICSFTHLIVALYLLWFGVIGLMVWA